MKVITLKLHSLSEWQFLLDLLRRLHISFEWEDERGGAKKTVIRPKMLLQYYLAVGRPINRAMN